MHTTSWDSLPAEMKYSVVELLDLKNTASFAKSSRETYALSIPTMFRDIKLTGYEALQSFVTSVPPMHCCYVRTLHITIPESATGLLSCVTNTLTHLLGRCFQIEELSLHIAGSLKPCIIPSFRNLQSLWKLSISNCGREDITPLSERLVVSIAASLPCLSDLTIDGISRSAIHAPELLGSYPFIPVVAGDDDLPAHPLLGFDLSLPSLLRIPTLRVLRMRETHMGDQRWCSTPALCRLDVLEVGSSCYESPDSNRIFAERILQNIGNSVEELSLSSSLASALSPVGGALPSLRQLRITKLFPLEYLAETLSALSHSPIELLSIECHEDDIEDMCYALEDFLNLCAEHRREPIYCHLKHISLQPVAETSSVSSSAAKLNTAVADSLSGDAAMAIQRVQQYLQDIRFSRK